MSAFDTISSRAQTTPIVIGLIGGPGAGKGTQCELICRKFKVAHISIGEVLRAEAADEDSPHREIIRRNMLAGTFAPKEISMAVVQAHIKKAAQGGFNVFVLDGFPRHLAQLHYFESVICPLKSVILMQCAEETMVDRLLARGRFDDNAQSIRGRLVTFGTTTADVVSLMRERGILHVVDAGYSVEAVSEQMANIFANFAETRE